MNAHILDSFRRLVRRRSGLILTEDKDYLLHSRLLPVAREAGLGATEALIARVAVEPDGPLAQRCIEALATHETYFFRDGAPFEVMAQHLLPELAQARAQARSLRILSAACSSGQEPYSLAMLLRETGDRLAGWRLEIVATDLSEPVLARARTGRYSAFETARGLSAERRARWMRPDGDAWRVTPDIASLVRFERRNLLDGLDGLGRFDLILCRNVLIYFDRADKTTALQKLAAALTPDGRLMLGSAETVVGLDSPFAPVAGLRGVYAAAPARTLAA